MREPGGSGAHPLAIALAERLRDARGSRILEIGAGSGRNTAFLRGSGFAVTAIADQAPEQTAAPQGRLYDAALSTHAFLHGTTATLRALLERFLPLLETDAPLYATFASTRDDRYGKGVRIAEHAYALETGVEAGVPHLYFDSTRLRSLLDRYVIIESLREENVDAVVGSWAHAQQPRGTVHWFLIGRRRPHRLV